MAKKTTKPWYQSKTMWVGIITALSGLLAVVETEYKLPGLFLTLKGLLDMWLRINTEGRIE